MVAVYSEALGQLGQDEPASGMALEPLVAFAPISGSVAIAIHHRNSECALSSMRAWGCGSGEYRGTSLIRNPCGKCGVEQRLQ